MVMMIMIMITKITQKKHKETEQRICNARQKTPKYIFGVFHNGSYYDYHFIIKVLMEVFEG